jgi:hypothetical protein
MKFKTLLITMMTLFISCAQNDDEENRAYYRKQVQLRINSIMTDSSYRELPAIHEEIEKIILVSKDSENPAAAVEKAGTLFESLCQTYGFDRKDFPDIEVGMSTDEMELRIRENELAFFDRMVMKSKPGSAQLFTAH